MSFTVNCLSSRESCFRVVVNSQNGFVEGELTRNVAEGINSSRNLLRITEFGFRKLGIDLPNSNSLKLLHAASDDAKSGSIRIAKGLVIAADKGAIDATGIATAVHRYGPVPLALLPIECYPQERLPELNVQGSKTKIRIGIYPDFSKFVKKRYAKARSNATVKECLASYMLGLDVIFLKYLEDVGEHFHDIVHHLSVEDALSRCREIEEVLTESIKLKLNQIRTHLNSTDPQLYSLAEENWRRYADYIVLASQARTYALYMLNEYYMLHDMFKKKKYADDMTTVKGFVTRFRSEQHMKRTSATDKIDILMKAFRAYGSNNLSELDQLYTTHYEWVTQFVDFTRFLVGLRQDKLRLATTRIFFSGFHENEAIRRLYADIHRFVSDGTAYAPQARDIQVLSVEKAEGGDSIDATITRRISASHGFVAAIPRDANHNLDWIVKETEHADKKSKIVRPFVQNGADLKGIQAQFATFDNYFNPRSDPRVNESERKKRMHDIVSGLGFYRFKDGEEWRVSPELERDLDKFTQEARNKFIFEKVDQLLNFLLPEYRLVLALTMKHTDNKRMTKVRICKTIANELKDYTENKIEKLFTTAWRAQKKRAIVINDAQYSLMKILGNKYYISNLRTIIKALRPELKSDHFNNLHRLLLSRIVS